MKSLEALERLERTLLAEGYWQDVLQDAALIKDNLEVLKILKECPFILSVLFSQNFDEAYTKKYMWGTIEDEQVDKVKKWLKDER